MIPNLPRPDHSTDDVRAWLYDGERQWLAALDCPDIRVSIDMGVSLPEQRDEQRRKKRRTPPNTPEQDAREERASDMLEDRIGAYRGASRMLREIAHLRRQLHAGAFDVEPSEATNHLRWQSLRWVYGDGQPRPIASGDLSRVEALAIAWPQDKRVPRD